MNSRRPFSVFPTLDKTCVKENPVGLISEVRILINENLTATDMIIYTDVSSAICVVWDFTAQCGGKTL